MRKHKITIVYQIDYESPEEYLDVIETYEKRGWAVIYKTTGYGDFSAFTILRDEKE